MEETHVEDIVNEVEMGYGVEDERIAQLKKKILLELHHNPGAKINDLNEMKKLDGKTGEELMCILQNLEIQTDSGLLFSKPKTVLRILVSAFSWFGLNFSYERLSQKIKLLKYIDGKLPSMVQQFGDELEIMFYLIEDLEISDMEQKNEERTRGGSDSDKVTVEETEEDNNK